ncbi:recombinase family protein [Lyngbya aestuarii]|uniref:recombinase family protein n=1 Tax=Lyngbya aestuarii TaxID=118322 RepID=UPI00403DC1AF
MFDSSIWVTGNTRSGKTTRLISQFCQWVGGELGFSNQAASSSSIERSSLYHSALKKQDAVAQLRFRVNLKQAPAILVFAANDDNRRDLAKRLTTAIQGKYPIFSKTPLGFFQDEVILFWPLLIEQLHLKAQFPLRLHPETEQDLAKQLWRSELDKLSVQFLGTNEEQRIRRLLDLLQLAGVSGTPIEDIPSMLEEGLLQQEAFHCQPELWGLIGQLLLDWRHWCLDKGLLTYGIICELYWRYLLPDPTYQQHLRSRYQGLLADDVDDYPAIARDLFEVLLDQGAVGAFTYNPQGKVRLGLNGDPEYLAGIAARCQVETLTNSTTASLADDWGEVVGEFIKEPTFALTLPESVVSMQTTSRAQILPQIAEVITKAVKSGQVQPREIAIIAPGLDAIARYTLRDLLSRQNIPIEPLNEQRPLISSMTIRALLTLLALVYPGLGRLVDRDAIAEMLVVLSREPDTLASNPKNSSPPTPRIDPVRAGLLADHCYSPDLEQPSLLPVASFGRWDRLGHRAVAAYSEILQWLEIQRQQHQQRLIPSVLALLDRAIQKFLCNGSNLPYDQLAALRELMETAQHFWEVEGRLRQESTVSRLNIEDFTQTNLEATNRQQASQTIARFIQLLRCGTVTANPYPACRLMTAQGNAVTLATVFQYRAAKSFHHWHFWLDAGSQLWSLGGAASLFAAPLFLKEWSGRPLTEEDKIRADEERLQRILRDLLGRVDQRVYLCHSELAVNGTEQNGPLVSLVTTAAQGTTESAVR